jgi:mannose-6-phosphate isomerase-like protein (cupin superfamily)
MPHSSRSTSVWSPRIVTRVNDYDVRIAKVQGEHVWHVHDNTDEFFLVLDGDFDIGLRDANGGTRTVHLHRGDVFVVPRGVEHRPSSTGASILMFEPAGTPSTGDRHDEIPDQCRQHDRPRACFDGRPRHANSIAE